MKRRTKFGPLFCLLLLLGGWAPPDAQAATKRAPQAGAKKAASKKAVARTGTRKATAGTRKAKAATKSRLVIRKASYSKRHYRGRRSSVAGGPWLTPTYANSTEGDRIDGEDLAVRQAAVDALGGLNGSVIVSDPLTGRILTLVNQRLALTSGFQPCSTVKLYAAVAAIQEGLIDGSKPMKLSRHYAMDMTEALAKSNNQYFATLGRQLGYGNFAKHARALGLGERAGWNIAGEQPGIFPPDAPAPILGGMGMMTSFGEGITLTPLQLAAVLNAFANGGKLWYLQHPKNETEILSFEPKLKRLLALSPIVDEMRNGLLGTTEWGTGQRAGEGVVTSLFGKTGTCTDRRSPTHLGWFGSFSNDPQRPLTVVVMLTGKGEINGPVASRVAGDIYRRLQTYDGVRTSLD